MGARSIVPHRHAIDDALDALDYYRENAGTPIAVSFSLAVDEALEQVGQHPNIGSPHLQWVSFGLSSTDYFLQRCRWNPSQNLHFWFDDSHGRM